MKSKDKIQILIIDMGSQYTLLIGRTLREIGYRSIILSSEKSEKWLKDNKPKGIILSGGSSSVYEKNAPNPPKIIFNSNIPVLGICYGMQLITHKLGGKVESCHKNKEYGEAEINFLNRKDLLFLGMSKKSLVWESHGDSVTKIPNGFSKIAVSIKSKTIAAISDSQRKMWGLQFHPEVNHTVEGKNILKNFVQSICKCEPDWKASDIISEIQNEVKNEVAEKRVIIGFSGGVDSTALSRIISPIFGKNLLAICIDTGALREGELEEIRSSAESAQVNLKIIKASKEFQQALSSAIDAELKRKQFKKVYGEIFDQEARKFKADFVAQGTLATDLIESGKTGKAALIKSHHNVGLNLKMKELHPFRNLFKYEVRDLARVAGLPEKIYARQPFPGPGLFVRVIGKPPTKDRLEIVRWADAEVTKILKRNAIYKDISQLVVALACWPTVGVKGDGRVYESSIIVRAVRTSDFMTIKPYQIPEEVRMEITEVITKHPKIVRVFYDETSKPPATTELE